MLLDQLSLNSLRAFHVVALEGSFTRAARRLGVTQPAMSRTIRSLEDRLGEPLLLRSRKSLRLTEVGEEYASVCVRIFGELQGLVERGNRADEPLRGTLALGASDNLCNYVLPRIVDPFLARHPALNLQLFTGAAFAIKRELRENRIEAGIFYTPLNAEEARTFVAEELMRVPFAFVVSSRIRGVPRDFDRAYFQDRLRYVGSRAADYNTESYPAMRLHERLGLRPKAFVETNSQETQKKLALLGGCYTLVPRHVVDNELRSGELREIRTALPLEHPVFLCRKRGTWPSRPLREFLPWLKDSFRKPAARGPAAPRGLGNPGIAPGLRSDRARRSPAPDRRRSEDLRR